MFHIYMGDILVSTEVLTEVALDSVSAKNNKVLGN